MQTSASLVIASLPGPTMRTSRLRTCSLATLLAVVGACSIDSPSAPLLSSPEARSNAGNALPRQPQLPGQLPGIFRKALTLLQVEGLTRKIPLVADISTTQTIGPAGGVLQLPFAGAFVAVPAGAVSVPTAITMTARAGKLVAYDFAPHGITFAKPLTFTQALKETNANPATTLLLSLGYYADPSQLTLTGASVSELINGSMNKMGWTFTAPISHFSGYMLSMGRSAATSEGM